MIILNIFINLLGAAFELHLISMFYKNVFKDYIDNKKIIIINFALSFVIMFFFVSFCSNNYIFPIVALITRFLLTYNYKSNFWQRVV
jgi:hypothetical protein